MTGVSLEVKAVEVQAQIAQATHVSGQLQDAVMNMREELADLCGLPVDADLELVRPDGGVTGVSLDTEAALSAA